jgi:hypothetical protein
MSGDLSTGEKLSGLSAGADRTQQHHRRRRLLQLQLRQKGRRHPQRHRSENPALAAEIFRVASLDECRERIAIRFSGAINVITAISRRLQPKGRSRDHETDAES